MSRPSFRRRRGARGLLAGNAPYVALGGFVLFVLLALRLAAPDALIALARPLWGLGQAGAAGVVTLLPGTPGGAGDAVSAENAALRAENAALAARVADLAALLGDRTEAAPGILAGVTARPPVAPYDTLVIDQGTGDGVRVGARAYGPGGTPIGAVTEAGERAARVTLYSTRGSVQQAWAGASRAPVELAGIGSGAFEASAPLGSGIAVGDGVYLADGGARPIGTVVAVDENPSAPRTVLFVRPYVNPFSLTWITLAP